MDKSNQRCLVIAIKGQEMYHFLNVHFVQIWLVFTAQSQIMLNIALVYICQL